MKLDIFEEFMSWTMSSIAICPTVTAFDMVQFQSQMNRLEFAHRLHIDFMDGILAPTVSPDLDKIWLPSNQLCDIHLMYQKPGEHLDKLIELKPHMVIIHYEAEVDHDNFTAKLRENGIRCGIAILQNTSIESIRNLTGYYDQVLIFSGDLGHHGGTADLSLFNKVQWLFNNHPDIEIAWDGGINSHNADEIVKAGVRVLNVGGFIQNDADPKSAYAKIEEAIQEN
jgi:ribulose-phosphate 3-epimerase